MPTGSKSNKNNPSAAIARNRAMLQAQIASWRNDGLTVALVPTMGSLHEGHLSLVTLGKRLADRCVASIFVNPTQFAANEDLDTYPRDEARDVALLEEVGCDQVYCPAPDEIYPAGFQTQVIVTDLAKSLCGASRPHFFGGVATVVCKLLMQCRPDIAVFGEKDFQQLLIIKRMVADLDMGVEIVGGPIVREKDGLAMSSRNAYLTPEERATAAKMNQHMRALIEEVTHGATIDETLARCREHFRADGLDPIDYLEIRDAENLKLLGPGKLEGNRARLFAAVMLGKTRLIDNMAIN